jgi:DNA invertase Pin-like site-specific DNA recombinase
MRNQPSNPPPNQLFRAAQYLRVSTEHQQYSIANQIAAIALYAAAQNIGIGRSFVDEGKSGTSIRGRKGLQELIRIVELGEADFDQVLVYDVSRWGRFPDSDEAAHYEYLCKRAGITVHYCAEQFENDNSTTSNLLKALKRTMAGEYSRELSVKVSAGQRRLAELGHWQGGCGPFGMQRQLVSHDGQQKRVLKPGEWKSISTDRITLIPGPRDDVRTVQLAFDLYTKSGKSRYEIAQILNCKKRLRGGKPWNIKFLRYLFSDPTYKGALAYGKHHNCRTVERDKWLIRERSFPAIVPEKQWTQAYDRIVRESRRPNDAEMLEGLHRLWKKKGILSAKIINEARTIPSSVAYAKHFGSINEAYMLIGYPPPRDISVIHAIIISRKMRRDLCEEISLRVRAIGGTAEPMSASGMIRINHNIIVKVIVRKARFCEGRTVWVLPVARQPGVDVLIIVRCTLPERTILDYLVIPAISQLRGTIYSRLKANAPYLDLYRFDDVGKFIETFRRQPVHEAA